MEHEKLAELTERLQRRIATSPPRSETARAARRQLDNFENPDCPLSTAQKLQAVRDTLRNYQRGLQFSDPVLYPPDLRKS